MGLNLTAAVRAAVLKYPWARTHYPDPHPTGWPTPPAGPGMGTHGLGAAKFSCYLIDLPEMLDALRAFPDLPPGRQTLECSVMDLADDIAYSLHDVEDFHRSGVLQFSPVSGEFRSWASDRKAAGRAGRRRAGPAPAASRAPGWSGCAATWPRATTWIFDEDTFAAAVDRVGDEFVDGVLARPYDGSMAADRAATGFSATWIDELIAAVRPMPDPAVRSGYVGLSRPAWHQVSVLKFVNQYFILERPDLAMLQRGQEQTVEQLVVAFDRWLADRGDAVTRPAPAGRPGRGGDPGLRAGRPASIRNGWTAGPATPTCPDGSRSRHHRLRQQPHRRPGGRLRRAVERGQRAALDHGRSVDGGIDAGGGQLRPGGLPAGGASRGRPPGPVRPWSGSRRSASARAT